MVLGIKAKLVLAVLACMALAGLAATWVVGAATQQNVTLAAQSAISGAGRALAAMERADVEKLETTAVAVMAHPGLAEAFAGRDRARLLALAAPLFARLRAEHDVTHLYFLDPAPARTCFLRVHKPEQFGDVVNRATLARAVETGKVAAGKELGQTAFALRVVQPWTVDGKLIGYLELGEEIDHFLGRMKAQTGDDYGLLVEKRYLDRALWAHARAGRRDGWDDHPTAVVVDGTTADPSLIDLGGDPSAVPDDGRLLGEVERGGRVLARGIVPVRDAAERRVGGLFVLHDITALHDATERAGRRVVWVLAAAAAAMALGLLWSMQRLVFARLTRMIDTLEDASARLAGGDYAVAATLPVGARDELGRFEAFFARFLEVIGGLLQDLTRSRTG